MDIPGHHVHIDDRGFFSKIIWVDPAAQEKEAKVEAFSKLNTFLISSILTILIGIVKEITEIEVSKFELWELYLDEIALIL